MKDKPNCIRRTDNEFTEKIMHAHGKQAFMRNAVNHIHFVLVIAMVSLLILPIVNCDNNVLNEIDNGGESHAKSTLTELTGGRVIGEKWLRQMESPYSLQMDMTVERSGKLFIEPGVTIHVAPMVGITVRGVLTALVSSMTRCVHFNP